MFEGSRRYLEAVAAAELAVAVVSSSANTREVLEVTGLDKFVQQRVDGQRCEPHIAGKPAPDSFLRAAELLGVEPAQATVFEDALAGVEAGRSGHLASWSSRSRRPGRSTAPQRRRRRRYRSS